jgi:hypothetical protein
VIGEAVWWVTIVDATLVRHHPDVYDSALAGHAPAVRQLIEGTLAGLRFVRNRMGNQVDYVDFIHPAACRPGADDDRITAWTWNPVPEPTVRVGPFQPREPCFPAWGDNTTAFFLNGCAVFFRCCVRRSVYSPITPSAVWKASSASPGVS